MTTTRRLALACALYAALAAGATLAYARHLRTRPPCGVAAGPR